MTGYQDQFEQAQQLIYEQGQEIAALHSKLADVEQANRVARDECAQMEQRAIAAERCIAAWKEEEAIWKETEAGLLRQLSGAWDAVVKERDRYSDTLYAITVRGLGLPDPTLDNMPHEAPEEWTRHESISDAVLALRKERDEALEESRVASNDCSKLEQDKTRAERQLTEARTALAPFLKEHEANLPLAEAIHERITRERKDTDVVLGLLAKEKLKTEAMEKVAQLTNVSPTLQPTDDVDKDMRETWGI
jgi:septal ring factor EnvC (AmiA/AmiB activator)